MMNVVWSLRPRPGLATASRRMRRCLSCHRGSICRTRSFSESAAPTYHSNHLSSHRIIDVADLAERMRAEVRDYTATCRDSPVRLAGILAVDAMPDRTMAEVYAEHIEETLREDGIAYEHVECQGEDPQSVESAIEEMNRRPDIHGILVYYPIFKKRKQERNRHGPYLNASTGVYYKSWDDKLRDAVCPTKDVEGLSHNYNSRWHFRARGRSQCEHSRKEGDIFVPCTALAVTRILETYHSFENDVERAATLPWKDVTVTVINRSEILGRPLAAMLALKGATVYSVDELSILVFQNGGRMRRCNEDHVTLDWCLSQSSIIVTGVPKPDFQLPLDPIISEYATVVNVSEFDNVNEDEVPCNFVPSIGRVTVAALEQNLISLHQKAISSK